MKMEVKKRGVDSNNLESVKISLETKELWEETQELGIRFAIQAERDIHLKTDFRNMRVSNTTYAEVQKTKCYFESRIKEFEKELIKLVLLRTRLEELIDLLESCEIDKTNADLIEKCIKTLNEK